jgi:hypothetical protein
VKAAHFLLLLPLLIASCASDSGNEESRPSRPQGATERSVDDWVSQTSKDNGFTQDANGNLVPKSNKRSHYERMGQDPNFQKSAVQKKEYKAGDFSKKSFWGNKEYDRKSFAGNTDGSRFSKASSLGNKDAREAATTSNLKSDYLTNSYSTGSAREAGRKDLAKPENDGIENRRDSFVQPSILGWQEQRSLSRQQSRSILGRGSN